MVEMIPLRATGCLVLLAMAALFVPTQARRVATSGFDLDPCTMHHQHTDAVIRIAALAWLGTFPVLLVQALRNRPLGKAWPLVCLLGLAWLHQYQLWQVEHCHGAAGLAKLTFYTAGQVLLCLHHLLCGPGTQPITGSQSPNVRN